MTSSAVVQLKPEVIPPDDPSKDYLDLDVSENGELLPALISQTADQAGPGPIALSDVGADAPAFFTPAMGAWYGSRVSFARRQAVQYVKTLMANDRPHNGGSCCLIEAEREAVEDNYIKESRQARSQVRQKRRADLATIDALGHDIDQWRNEYAALKDQLGREPQVPNPWVYGGIMALVSVAELLINFESFASLSWATPFIATGLSLVIGLMIALASHMHGTLLKRYRSYFDDDVDTKLRWVAGRMFAIGTTGLTLALLAVAYARNVYFAQNALSAAAFGDGGGGGQKLWIVGGSLLGNLIVYLVGLVLAYLMHDEVARFTELKVNLDRSTARRNALMTSIDAEIADRLKAAETRHHKGLQLLQNRETAQHTAPNYSANRKLFDAIVGQDGRVIAALQAYRIQICNEKKDQPHAFQRNDRFDPELKCLLDATEYLQLTLTLKFS